MKNSKIKIFPFALTWLFLVGTFTSEAKFSYPGCDDVTDEDFKQVKLMSSVEDGLKEPLKMAFDKDAQGNVHIFFVERYGAVKRYDAISKKVTQVHKVNVSTISEDGLTGIALDPNFKSNKWIYLFYTIDKEFKLSRFEYKGSKLQNEKIMLSIPKRSNAWHTGGAMQFDAYGDLWLTVGDNKSNLEGTANTSDLRGKVLRITPKSDGSYDIPAGNLFPKGTPKTRPEIYVMGTRNAYSMTLDPVRRWVTIGDVGPDTKKNTEEHDLYTKPGNGGWPHFAGANHRLGRNSSQNPLTPKIDPAWAKHKNFQGLLNLPPSKEAVHSYIQSAAVTGPIYRYDGNLGSKVKFPPHFNRKWFVTDFKKSWVHVLTLNDAGTKVLRKDTIFKKMRFSRPLDFQQGPDGALYMLNYAGWKNTSKATSIDRIEYTGNCHPSTPKLETPKGVSIRSHFNRLEKAPSFSVTGVVASVELTGPHQLQLVDLNGKILDERNGVGRKSYRFSQLSKPGVYFIRGHFHSANEKRTITQKVVNLP